MSENKNLYKEMDLIFILNVLFRNKIIILSVTFLSMVTILILCVISIKLDPKDSFLPNKFSPKSTVIINSSSSSSGFDSILSNSNVGAIAGLAGINNSPTQSDSALAIRLTSTNSFIEKLDKSFDLSEVYDVKKSRFPKSTLKQIVLKKILLTPDEESGLLTISYTDIDKYLATDIVNKVTDLLEEEFAKIDNIRNRSQYALVEDKKALVEDELNRLQSEIIKFQIKHDILDVNIVAEEMTKLISGLQAQLIEKEVKIESYGKVANLKDPQYNRLLNERDAIIKSINKVEDGKVGDYPPLKDLPILALELEELKRKLEVQLIGYKALIQQSETLKLTKEGTGPTFQVLELAEVPEMKSGPSRGKLCVTVTVLGFLFSLFIVFIKEIVTSIINDPIKMKRLKGK